MTTEYRAYFFGNMYLSPIQQGIQAAHVIGDMFTDNDTVVKSKMVTLKLWAKDNKTIILLNGGYQENLLNIYDKLIELTENLNFPVGKFHEEMIALNGACTSVGIIIPSYIYNEPELDNGSLINKAEYPNQWGALFDRRLDMNGIEPSSFKSCMELHKLIKSCRLA